jgi:exosome complex component RRP41
MVNRTGEITLMQLDGSMTKEEINEALKMAKKACNDINRVQKEALKNSFAKEEKK